MIKAIVPTLNEEKAISEVVRGFPESYKGENIEVLIVDGGSSDRTVKEAIKAGAEVIQQSRLGGKGNAIHQAISQNEVDYYVLIDGDSTYDPEEVDKLLEPLIKGKADHVIGKRSKRDKNSIPLLNLIGNKIFNALARISTGKKIGDMLSGYRAFSRESLEYTNFSRPGFGIETEMTISALENNVPIEEVEVSYYRRKGDSKLEPLKDGFQIIKTLLWSVRDLAPLRFFGFGALTLLLIAAYPSFLVFEEKITTGRVQSLGPVIFSALCIILAFQTLMFGIIADQIRNVERRGRWKE